MASKIIATGTVTALQSGQGPDLVILHSLLTDRAAFDLVVPRLERHYRVTRINLPGYHGCAAVSPTTEALVGFVRDAWSACGIAPEARLLGNGLGGTLALAFAMADPSRLAELILCDAVAGFPEAGREPFRQMAARVEAGGMGAIAEIAARRVFHDAYLASHPMAIEERRQVLLKVDPVAFQACCQFLAHADLTPRLGDMKVPTRVICGELDQATPPALARIVADRVPGATYVEIANCGHCPPLESPDDFLSALTMETR
jgi:3-oxoadipate enol-lactonase